MAIDDLHYMRLMAAAHHFELRGEADNGGDVPGLRVRLAAMAEAYIREVSAPDAEALLDAYHESMRQRDAGEGRPEDRSPKPAPRPRPSPPLPPLLPPIVWVVAAVIALLAFV